MKIGDSPPAPPGADGPKPQQPGATEPTGGPDEPFADRLDRPAEPVADPASEGVEGAGPAASPAREVRPAGETDLVDMAARVDQGDLSPEEAVELVVERVLDAQLPPDASPLVRARVRSLVEASLQSDPLLSSLVKRLGGDR